MRLIINAFIFYLNAYLILADNSLVGNLFINGNPRQPPPPPSPIVEECLRSVQDKLESCQTDAVDHWNITKHSPVKNICCADWELIDCDLSAVKGKCTAEEIVEVKKYVEEVVEYLNDTTCTQYPKGTAQCTLEMLLLIDEELIDDRPPLPKPTVIDCLDQFSRNVKRTCDFEARLKWNITRKSHQRPPIRNVCCATWDDIDCLDEVVKIRCPSIEVTDTEAFFKQIEDWAAKGACNHSTYHSANCSQAYVIEEVPLPQIIPEHRRFPIQDNSSNIPIDMLLLIDDRPPLPKPTVIDCLDQFSRNVKRTCDFEARLKWNITRKSHQRPPIRNVCCATWDDIDCLDEVVRIRCPSIEVTDTEAYFKQIEDWAAKGACNQSTYHSANCSQSYFREEIPLPRIIPENRRFPIQDNSPYIPIPQVDDEKGFSKQEQTYFYFALNYVMSAFPHLLHMMIILAIILITIVVIQCVIITRQVKQDRMITDYIPQFQGYRKV